MAPSFDTLAYARRLREGGFSEEQAETQAAALAVAMTESLATKQDLKELESRLETRFAHIDTRFSQIDVRFSQVEARFSELSDKLTMRMLLAVGTVSALSKLL